jgi:arylsulfatase A-like enzyme
VKNYYRLITGVDDLIGDMMKKLETIGIADNTIIILMGDNGMFLGEHGMEGKWYGYEESIRVPLFIYAPDLPDKVKL